MTDITLFFAAIFTALTLTEFSSADGTDPGDVFLPTSAGVNQITP